MAVTASDIKYYKSLVNNDTLSNGGRIGTTEIITNQSNNFFPNVSDAERTAGLTRYRKFFIRNHNADDLNVDLAYSWIETNSPGGNYYRIKGGTDTDVQSAADDYTEWAGSGFLYATEAVGQSEIQVDYEAADGVYNASKIRISDGTNTEYHVVNGAPSWSGNRATITLTGTLANTFTVGSSTTGTCSANSGTKTVTGAGTAFLSECAVGDKIILEAETNVIHSIASDTALTVVTAWGSNHTGVAATLNKCRVSTMIFHDTIAAASGSWVETTSAGTYNEASYPLTLYNVGTVTDSWTLTFSSATDFAVSGSNTGSAGSGSTANDFKPPNGSSFYFLLSKDGWGGTWQSGDTITFTTTHAGEGVWIKEITPALTDSQSNNTFYLGFKGEST